MRSGGSWGGSGSGNLPCWSSCRIERLAQRSAGGHGLSAWREIPKKWRPFRSRSGRSWRQRSASGACSTSGTSRCVFRTPRMKLPQDFRDLWEEFAREGVEHIVIGGHASAFHAEPRATKYLDLLLGGSRKYLERAARALARYGAPANVVESIKNLGETEIACLGRPPLRIDLLRTVDGAPPRRVLSAVGRCSVQSPSSARSRSGRNVEC